MLSRFLFISLISLLVMLTGCSAVEPLNREYSVHMKPIPVEDLSLSFPWGLRPLSATRDHVLDRMIEDANVNSGLVIYDRLVDGLSFKRMSDRSFRSHFRNISYEKTPLPHHNFVVERANGVAFTTFKLKADWLLICTAFSSLIEPVEAGYRGHVYGFVCGRPTGRVVELVKEIRVK